MIEPSTEAAAAATPETKPITPAAAIAMMLINLEYLLVMRARLYSSNSVLAMWVAAILLARVVSHMLRAHNNTGTMLESEMLTLGASGPKSSVSRIKMPPMLNK